MPYHTAFFSNESESTLEDRLSKYLNRDRDNDHELVSIDHNVVVDNGKLIGFSVLVVTKS